MCRLPVPRTAHASPDGKGGVTAGRDIRRPNRSGTSTGCGGLATHSVRQGPGILYPAHVPAGIHHEPVRQLSRVLPAGLVAPARWVDLLPRADKAVFVDLDPPTARSAAHAKQGAADGRLKGRRKTLSPFQPP